MTKKPKPKLDARTTEFIKIFERMGAIFVDAETDEEITTTEEKKND